MRTVLPGEDSPQPSPDPLSRFGGPDPCNTALGQSAAQGLQQLRQYFA
jgi:hypothetical protein